jgi:polygalacturonase
MKYRCFIATIAGALLVSVLSAPAVAATPGPQAFDGQDVIPGQSTLYWNGALRSKASAPPEVVNITSFGAVCDGAFDNSSAIADAIASAKSRGWRCSFQQGSVHMAM